MTLGRVLVVEDDEPIAEGFCDLLTRAGFATVWVETARRALEELTLAPFDFVLTDHCLPSEDGQWMVKQAIERGLLKGAAVLMVTADPRPQSTPELPVLRKPVDAVALLKTIHRLLQERKDRSGSGPRLVV